jgi:hypothetical protein
VQKVDQVSSLKFSVFTVEEYESELLGQQLGERLIPFVRQSADDVLIVEPVVEGEFRRFLRVIPLRGQHLAVLVCDHQ